MGYPRRPSVANLVQDTAHTLRSDLAPGAMLHTKLSLQLGAPEVLSRYCSRYPVVLDLRIELVG
jgi:hypothetical protein